MRGGAGAGPAARHVRAAGGGRGRALGRGPVVPSGGPGRAARRPGHPPARRRSPPVAPPQASRGAGAAPRSCSAPAAALLPASPPAPFPPPRPAGPPEARGAGRAGTAAFRPRRGPRASGERCQPTAGAYGWLVLRSRSPEQRAWGADRGAGCVRRWSGLSAAGREGSGAGGTLRRWAGARAGARVPRLRWEEGERAYGAVGRPGQAGEGGLPRGPVVPPAAGERTGGHGKGLPAPALLPKQPDRRGEHRTLITASD